MSASLRQIAAGVLLACVTSAVAHAGAPMRLEDGARLQWRPADSRGPIRLELVGNTLNVATVYPEELRNAAVAGLQSWARASDGLVEFDYWQGPDPDVYPTGLANDGVSTIFFASAAGPELGLSRSTAAYTHVWVDPQDGFIEEVDIVLNDLGYDFTTDPLEVDVFSSKPVLLLRSVVTHELGHALGLDHSGVYDSTMFTWSWPGQDTLGCDDVQAIRRHLGHPSVFEGSAFGHVVDEGGKPVLGAHVVAVRADGAVVGSTLTDESGYYNLTPLAPGRYAFIVEPFFAGADALSPGYAAADHRRCDGKPFSRTLAGADDASPLIAVQLATALGETVVGCGPSLQGPMLAATEERADAPMLLDGVDRRQVTGLVRVPATEERYVRLTAVNGTLRIRATTYGLFSPISAKLALYDSGGARVPVPVARPRFADEDSGFVEWDTELEVTDLPAGDYVLEIGADLLLDTLYPRGDLYLDQEPFAMITATLDPAVAEPACITPVPNPAAYRMPDAPVPPRDEASAPSGCRVGGTPSPLTLGLWLLVIGAARIRPRAR